METLPSIILLCGFILLGPMLVCYGVEDMPFFFLQNLFNGEQDNVQTPASLYSTPLAPGALWPHDPWQQPNAFPTLFSPAAAYNYRYNSVNGGQCRCPCTSSRRFQPDEDNGEPMELEDLLPFLVL